MTFADAPASSHCKLCGATSTRRAGVSAQVSRVLQPSGGREPAHVHDTARLVIGLSGRYDERSASRASDVRVGTAFFRPAGVVHSEEYIYDDVRYVSIAMPAEFCDNGPSASSRRYAAPFVMRNEAIRALGLQLEREVGSLDAAAPIALESLVLELLAYAALADDSGARRPPRWIATARAFIEAHYDTATPAVIARELGLDASYVARTFRAHVGRTVGDAIRVARVMRAMRRLPSEPDTPVTQVALEAGFFDQSHFNRVFKRLVGVTPLHYRTLDRSARRSLQKSKSS